MQWQTIPYLAMQKTPSKQFPDPNSGADVFQNLMVSFLSKDTSLG